MEIRINKEIKDYRESIFFGLTLRQFFCSVIAVGAALGIYFGLKNVLGRETVSWLCIVCAAPFATAGFFNYNGMTFEQFVVAVIRSEFIYSGLRLFKSENYLYNMLQEVEQNAEKPKQTGKKKGS